MHYMQYKYMYMQYSLLTKDIHANRTVIKRNVLWCDALYDNEANVQYTGSE